MRAPWFTCTLLNLGLIKILLETLFVIEVEERRGRKARQSYQYVDVLTGTVELYDMNTGERLLDYTADLPEE